MGRTLKRVPLDFAWPLKKVWYGYVNPHNAASFDCAACDGTGHAPEAKLFSDQWYGNARFNPVVYGATSLTIDNPKIVALAERNVSSAPEYYGTGDAAVRRETRRLFEHFRYQWCHHLIQADVDALVADGRLMDFTRRPRTEEQAKALAETGNYWMKESNGYTPTADEVNEWSIDGMGHDAINRYCCVKARCEREGFEVECPECKGEGTRWASDADKEAAESWEDVEPPSGEGFQLWETTSEGSPASPVFSTIEALCDWCADNATTFADHKTTAEKWREMLDADFVCHREGNAVFL